MAKPWFTPKRYGYGSGLPCSWEGWLTLAVYLVAVPLSHVLVLRFLPPPTAMIAWLTFTSVMTAALILIARARTEGGWRWRNGNK